MLVIRLLRTGRKNQPFFKIVVTDKRNAPRAGRFVEDLGFVNPLTKEKKVNADRVKYWLSVGAKPSETVYNLLVSQKIIEGKKIPLHKTKKKSKEESKESSDQQKNTSEQKPVS
jgi:small subunit ribosomal protein S16